MSAQPVRFPRPASAAPSLPGYEVGEVIGRGAMGVVYRARQLNVDREVALKVLHPELSSEPRLVRRLQREARTTARLAHPHVVSAIDMGEVDGTWWYAMEYVDGSSLALRLRQEGALKEREVLRLFIPLCEALEHLYEHGVVHRDIKPANILIGRRGGARLADLGLAFADDDPNASSQGSMLGTPHYISPEQAMDASSADVRSDIWSFGATLYHALCGRPPFSGNSTAEILSEVLYSQVTDPRELEPTLSRGIALVLRKCLSREPELRYQTPHELLLDLERVREHRAPKVRRKALEPVHRAKRVRLWLLLGGALVGIASLYLAWTITADGGGASSTLPQVELGPYEPLEALAARARQRPNDLAQHQGALADLRRELVPDYMPRWQEVDRELRGALRRRVEETQLEVSKGMQAHLEARKYVSAEQILAEGFPRLIFERTGYTLEQLDVHVSTVTPWLERNAALVMQRADTVSRELQGALDLWADRRIAEVEVEVARQNWRTALGLLAVDRAKILEAAGYGEFELPPRSLDSAVDRGALAELLFLREDVKQRWRTLDRQLQRRVRTRAETMAAELEVGMPRPEASRGLGEWFELELVKNRLRRAQMPEDLALTCLEELARAQKELLAREWDLLEADSRAQVEQIQELGARYWRERDYELLRALWHQLAIDLGGLAERVTGSWRSDLEALALLRREESDLLGHFLRSASARVRSLDGMTIQEIRVGAVTYSKRRILAPTDPLAAGGFQLEGLNRLIDLRSLPSEQLQELAGLREASELSALRKLELAAFLYHEKRLTEARDLLRTDLFEEGIYHDLELDLSSRVHDAVELSQRQREGREETARDLIEKVFAQDLQLHSPSTVVSRIDLLLAEYADIERVRARMADLRDLRGALFAAPNGSVEDLLKANYGPSKIEFPVAGRVTLSFEFTDSLAGAWVRGDWIFDGAGWIAEERTFDWQGFQDQRGPRLPLGAPLDSDSFDLSLEFDVADEGPPQLLTVSMAGFHVGLIGPGLPGADPSSRYLVQTGEFEEFLAKIREGRGEFEDVLLQEGTSHTLRLRGYRPSGRLRLELDGRALREVRIPSKGLISPILEIRSWDRIRLTKVVLEVGR